MEKNRLNDFKDAVNSLNVKSGAPDRDKLYQRLGAILMISGIVLAFVAYFVAGAQNSGDLAVDNIPIFLGCLPGCQAFWVHRNFDHHHGARDYSLFHYQNHPHTHTTTQPRNHTHMTWHNMK